jgi:hypothetical protein
MGRRPLNLYRRQSGTLPAGGYFTIRGSMAEGAMSFWHYWGLVFSAALRQTFSHARQKILLGLMLSIIAFLFQWRVLRLHNWTDTEKIITSLLAASDVVMAGSLMKNLLMGPVLLHRKQQSGADDLTERFIRATSELAQAKAAPSFTPLEREQGRLVEEKMESFNPEEAKVIEALLRHGEIHRRDVTNLGFPIDLFYRAIDKGKSIALIKEREERFPAGKEQYLSINPALEAALQHYFTRSAR